MPEMKTLTVNGVKYDIRDDSKAPAGYGLGDTATRLIESLAELDALKIGGSFRYACNGTTLAGVYFNHASIEVVSAYGDCITQIIRPMNTDYKIERTLHDDGTWGEWINASPSAFAPSGYGLGTVSPSKHIEDLYDAKETGLYTIPVTISPTGVGGWVWVNSFSDSYKSYTFSDDIYGANCRQTIMNKGVIQPWVDCSPSAFAPSGYGLGTGGVFVTDCNKAIKPGFYATSESTINRPDWYISAYAAMLVTERGGEIYQKLFMNAIYGYTEIVRYSGDGGTTWSEWEWVNPLMILGAEYRTTERYDGGAVYRKAVTFRSSGAISGDFTIPIGIGNANVLVDCFVAIDRKQPLPYLSDGHITRVGALEGDGLLIKNNNPYFNQNYTWYVELAYTKTV